MTTMTFARRADRSDSILDNVTEMIPVLSWAVLMVAALAALA